MATISALLHEEKRLVELLKTLPKLKPSRHYDLSTANVQLRYIRREISNRTDMQAKLRAKALEALILVCTLMAIGTGAFFAIIALLERAEPKVQLNVIPCKPHYPIGAILRDDSLIVCENGRVYRRIDKT